MGDIALMGARAARAGVMLRQIEQVPRLKGALSPTPVSRHAADADYQTELSAWSGRHGSVVGVPARNAPPPEPVRTDSGADVRWGSAASAARESRRQ